MNRFLNLALCLAAAANAVSSTSFNLKPFKVDLSSRIPRLHSLVNNTQLLSAPLYAVDEEKGVELDFLVDLKDQWVTTYDWDQQQAELNA